MLLNQAALFMSHYLFVFCLFIIAYCIFLFISDFLLLSKPITNSNSCCEFYYCFSSYPIPLFLFCCHSSQCNLMSFTLAGLSSLFNGNVPVFSRETSQTWYTTFEPPLLSQGQPGMNRPFRGLSRPWALARALRLLQHPYEVGTGISLGQMRN